MAQTSRVNPVVPMQSQVFDGVTVSSQLRVRHAVRMALGAITLLSASPLYAELPIPCSTGTCGVGGPNAWVTAGSAGLTSAGTTATIQQNSARAVLNWQSFNISSDSSVEFRQPDAAAIAINKIFQANPSQIFGKLTANGQVYLINQNGILFGKGAQVNTASLVASSLDITPKALENGLVRAINDSQPAFEAFRKNGQVTSGNVEVQQGASLATSDGGQILLFAPNVVNRGSLNTPNGQTVLAAGTKIYLAISGNSDVRGLVVEVDVEGVSDVDLQKFLKGELAELPLGKAQNFGSINAATGNISLVGLAVNQAGRVTASSSVLANGTVYLRAADTADQNQLTGPSRRAVPTRGGKVTLDEGSVTEVQLESTSTETTVDVNKQPRSSVNLVGHTVQLLANSSITAKGGNVSIVAQANPSASDTDISLSSTNNNSRVLVESGARIDVSGATVKLAADSQTLAVELFSEQLKDSPLQRDGVLKGKTITVDLRQSGVRDDGIAWVGTPLADVTGKIDGIQRTVAERNVQGGTISITSQGDVIAANGSVMDISGGRIDYAEGLIQTTQLRSQGQVVDIARADPSRLYDGIVGEATHKDSKWGVTENWKSSESLAVYSPAYSEGRDAGTLSINSPRLVLDSMINGAVTHGPNQRQPVNAPSGATLVVGYQTGGSFVDARYRADAIRVAEQMVSETLAQTGFNARRDVLPTTIDAITLRPSLFGDQGIAHAVLLSNKSITVPEQATLTLPAGGSINMRGDSVVIAGQISAPSGNISATAVRTTASAAFKSGEVTLKSGAKLDVSGVWVNDSASLGSDVTTPVWINGGKVSLSSANAGVQVEAGASLDASGSAWLQANGKITAGVGGSISLSGNRAGSKSGLQLDGQMVAYGLTNGGSLNLTTDSVCISVAGCDSQAASTTALQLSPTFFQQGGFSGYSLTSNVGELIVAGDANIRLQQVNRVLDTSAATRQSGIDLEKFSSVQLLPDYLRQATNLSLTTSGNHPAELRVERGAIIQADAGAALSLSARSRMLIDGTLVAPGGSVKVSLLNNSANQNFIANEALWLGAHATIDVSGTTLLQPNSLALKLGEVRSGGSISLTANRGYVLAEQGSRLDVSGAAASLDIRQLDGSYQRKDVGSNAGSIAITAAEGAVLEGELKGQRGTPTSLGGIFSLKLDGNTRGEPSQLDNPGNYGYPHASRVIEVIDAEFVGGLNGVTYQTLDAGFTAASNGIARINGRKLSAAGFDSLELTARNLLNLDSDSATRPVASSGTVRLNGDLRMDRRIVIDAPVIDVVAPSATIAAPYIALGSTDVESQFVPTPSVGSRSLLVHGSWIDVLGASSISGAGSVHLQSDNDLRLRALPTLKAGTRVLTGSLLTAGELTLQATQLYPATLTDFSVTALNGANNAVGKITVLPTQGMQSAVLSAGGSLQLNAAIIEQQGVIKAPFGSIELNATGTAQGAGQLSLAAGSVTSTSAAGAIIPIGRTEGGLDWIYDLGNQQKLVLSSKLDGIPEQRIKLSGTEVALSEGAVINLSASGDMQAYEFVAGVGGSRDILSLVNAPNRYAIVPVLAAGIAPFDQQESAGFKSLTGTTVTLLEGVNGLAAGEYALLPARYALLPGAYLIADLSGYRDLSAGARNTLRDGTPIIAGAFSVAGTDQLESRTRGFSVLSSDFLRDATNLHRPAEYRLSLASNFFAAQLLADGGNVSRLPIDAGTLAISARQSLDLQATLLGAAGKGGRGAAVDIASDRIVIITDSTTPNGNAVPIKAESLNRLGAESILLGGLRTATLDGTRLDLTSSEVTIAADAHLLSPEIILAARDNLIIAAGASVTGKGSAIGKADTYLLSGDGAVLRVSSGSQANLARSNVTGTTGSFTVASNAVIAADGSVAIDASANTSFNGKLQLDGGDLSIGASQINLGAVPGNATGFSLDKLQLSSLSVDQLLLRSRSDINFYDAPTLSAQQVTLDAGGIVARSGGSSAVTTVSANRVTITNTTQAPESLLPDTGHGRLEINAQDVELAGGSYLIGGFSEVKLAAQQTLLGRNSGKLAVKTSASAAADLSLTAGVIGGYAGANTGIEATGSVTIASSGTTPGLPLDTLGVDLNVTGSSIRHGGRIVTEAGRVTLNATGAGGVTVASGGVIDVSGALRQFDTAAVFAPGGVIALNAASGDVNVDSGAVLDVSGAEASGQGGNAGAIHVSTPLGSIRIDGAVNGRATTGQRQGRVDFDGRQIASLDLLNTRLNAAGFTDERVLRIREGDVNLDSDIVARHIDITVDGLNNTGGALTLGGRLDASGAAGGKIRLAARGDITATSAATIDVSASNANSEGGTLEMMSQSGGVKLLAGSNINAAGGAQSDGGSVRLRVDRSVLEQLVANPGDKQVALDGVINGAREVIVEGVKSYQDIDGTITEVDQAQAFADADIFMQSATDIAAALGRSNDSRFHVRPGVDVWSAGNLTVANNWDLFDWRFNGQPGYLTLRAAGDLIVNQQGSLSDGISANYFNFLEQPVQNSWSYRLIAGADLDGASPFAVKNNTTLGSLLLAAGAGSQRAIRTGTGDIEIVTARDLRLADQYSVIYTTGVPVTDLSFEVRDLVEFQSLTTAALAEKGGNIVIKAGGDVIGVPTNQLVTDWLWRAGSQSDNDFPSPTMWGSEFSRFQSGVGALAGGDISIIAGGTVDNVSAAIPTIGVPVGATQYDNQVDIRGGGDLRVEAGGDIGGGVYYIGRGKGELSAGGDIRAGTNWLFQATPLHTTLALGDGQFFLTARGDATIETVFNPTVQAFSAGQLSMEQSWKVDFSTYTDTSAVSLNAIAGDVLFSGNTFGLHRNATNTNALGPDNDVGGNTDRFLKLLPPSLKLRALTGNIVNGVNGVLVNSEPWTLSPSPQGQLELLARGNVIFDGLSYLISDTDPAEFPTPENPVVRGSSTSAPTISNLLNAFGPLAHADVPVHSIKYATSAGYMGQREPALIVAQTGDINMSVGGASLRSAKSIKLIAGRDIIDPELKIQNIEATDVSVVSAGRDITYSLTRNSNRNIQETDKSILIDGPGELLMSAGRDIDLKASPGVVTRGNTVNPALADNGAGITALVGTGATAPDYDGFIRSYLVERDTYQSVLAKYMEQRGIVGSQSVLLAAFNALPREQQIPLLARLLFAELRAVGRKAATEGTGDYAAGYKALATLFPDIDPEQLHSGDLSLFFSRIYTLDGGDLNLLVPGGVLNAGLAAAPESFGVVKTPSELGIVAQTSGDVSILTGQDTLVNQSRIFAADGGSILIWSSAGDIDAGRGAKTAISAPPPVITYDANGNVTVEFGQALSGSGIRAFVTTAGRKPGDVDLFAPTGVILVNDAGIGTAGNLTIGATQVVGADNIDVGGTSVGVPVETGGLGASLAGVSASSSSANNAAVGSESGGDGAKQKAPVAQAALSWLDVFVVGLGEDNCRQDDLECLKRQSTR